MRRKGWICLLLLSFSVSLQAQRGIQQLKPKGPDGKHHSGDQWLLAIGINSYLRWDRLKTAVRDARTFKDVLITKYYFQKERVVELYDEQATRKNILGAFRMLAEEVKPDDVLVIYYAGHGHIDRITKMGSWIPVEGDLYNPADWLSNQEIMNYLKVDVTRARHILLISDSCFSGDFFRGTRQPLPEITEPYLKRAAKLNSRKALTSGGMEPVSDQGYDNHSIFAYYFLEFLDKNTQPFLAVSEIYRGIRADVSENASQFPEFGSLQGTGGLQGGEFIFIYNPSWQGAQTGRKLRAKKKEMVELQALEEQEEAIRRQALEVNREKEKELVALEAEIEELRQKLGMNSQTRGTLDDIHAMVLKKEQQEARLKDLEQEKTDRLMQQEKEFARLEKEKEEMIKEMVRKEVMKYQKIASSKFGKSKESQAWQSLIENLPEEWTHNVARGDAKTLLMSPRERREAQRDGFSDGIWHGSNNLFRLVTKGYPPLSDWNTGWLFYYVGFIIGLLIAGFFGMYLAAGLFFLIGKLFNKDEGFGIMGLFLFVLTYIVYIILLIIKMVKL